MATVNVPVPEPSESRERFTVRAHKALMDAVPDPEERNELVWEAWRKHRGPDEAEALAAKKFDSNKYYFSPNRCYFDEHETTRPDGTKKRFDARELVKIVRDNNERIVDRGCFAAISPDHTVDDPAAPDKPPLGFAGPYRLGMVGRKNPTWAIFGDEYHRRDKLNQLQDLPRRSVELLTFKSTGKQIFDPIAALGSKAPRLSLPTKYHVNEEEAEVLRYSVVAPSAGAMAYPGGSNTYAKDLNSAGDKKMLQDENALVAKIVEAIMATPEMQYVRQQMEKTQGAEDGSDAAGAGGEPADYPEKERNMATDPNNDSVPPTDNAADDADDLEDLLNPVPVPPKKEPEPDPERDYHSARNGRVEVTAEQYSALASSHNNLIKSVKGLLSENKKLKLDRADADRKARIDALANKYGIDASDEYARCLYSAGANMTDEQFNDHVDTIEKYASRFQAEAIRIPAGEMPGGGDVEVDRKAAELAVEIHTNRVNRGENSDWDSALEEARKQLTA